MVTLVSLYQAFWGSMAVGVEVYLKFWSLHAQNFCFWWRNVVIYVRISKGQGLQNKRLIDSDERMIKIELIEGYSSTIV